MTFVSHRPLSLLFYSAFFKKSINDKSLEAILTKFYCSKIFYGFLNQFPDDYNTDYVYKLWKLLKNHQIFQ